MSTIELIGLDKYFGDFAAVRDFNLSVGAGEVVCLLGPSGCGKTTTLRMIAGLEEPTYGDVIVGGKRINNLSTAQRDIAMVFQFYALYPALTVAENLAFPLHAERLSTTDRDKRVNQVAETLQLTEVLDRKPAAISEGEKQRVAVARAIIRDPTCFLFDEPLSRLDVELRETMRGQIKEVLQGLSKATVIVTHDQLEALTMADRITIMRDGFVEQIGTPHEVFVRPENAFVASFIGTPRMNLIDVTLISTEGTTAAVKIGGSSAEISVDPAVAGMEPGKITVGIRPRAFSLAGSAGPTAISVVAELIEPMGAETLIHTRTASDEEIRVIVPRENRVAVGEALHLMPDAGQTHVFNGAGEAVRQ